MVKTIYKLDKFGNLTKLSVNIHKIQEYINKVKGSLTVTFYNLEGKCFRSEMTSGAYKQYFTRNVIELTEEAFSKEDLGIVENYEYYQDIYFDDEYIIHYRLTARINYEWEFRYIIKDFRERLPSPIMQMIMKHIAIHIDSCLKEIHELDINDIPK